MSKITFSFLLIHDGYQDAITYEIDHEFRFEDVIKHICSSFNIDFSNIQIKSSLGLVIDDFDYTVEEVDQRYGKYFKLIKQPPQEESPLHQSLAQSHRDYATKESGSKQSMINDQEAFHDMLDDLILFHPDNWQIDEQGMVELTIIPEILELISFMQVRYHTESNAVDLFREISTACGFSLENSIITHVKSDPTIINNIDMPVIDLLRLYGGTYIIYPKAKGDEIGQNSSEISQQIQNLLYKYKT